MECGITFKNVFICIHLYYMKQLKKSITRLHSTKNKNLFVIPFLKKGSARRKFEMEVRGLTVRKPLLY